MDKLIPYSRPRPDAPTAREREILTHIWAGLTSQEIAARLQIAPKTVESHRANLLRKFRATNSAQLLRLALLEGILHMPSSTSTGPSQTAADAQSTTAVRKLTNLK
ncbi:MAG TPA: helix-turn-helix transcriptional regulator [Nitrospira sp.]|nr:helix-turn-helix transcriptional regulator [Nitrospira sp.]HNP80941.1 helix-turn-helix transcriptional regulator [Nitrospira sp.]